MVVAESHSPQIKIFLSNFDIQGDDTENSNFSSSRLITIWVLPPQRDGVFILLSSSSCQMLLCMTDWAHTCFSIHDTQKKHHLWTTDSQSVDNPPDTTNSADLHNKAPSLRDYSNPFKLYLSNSLSSPQRYEAGNKTLGLKGSSSAHPLLDCPPPLLPATPAALLISLIFNLTWTVINAPPMKGERHKGYFPHSLSSTGLLQLFKSPPFLMTSLSPDYGGDLFALSCVFVWVKWRPRTQPD